MPFDRNVEPVALDAFDRGGERTEEEAGMSRMATLVHAGHVGFEEVAVAATLPSALEVSVGKQRPRHARSQVPPHESWPAGRSLSAD